MTRSRGILPCWTPHSLGIGRVSCLASSTLTSNPQNPCLVGSWSSTICPVWPDYNFDRWPEQPSAKYSRLQQKATLISFQCLKCACKVTLSTQRWLLFLLLMSFQMIWLESIWYWAALLLGGMIFFQLCSFWLFLDSVIKWKFLTYLSVLLWPFCHETAKKKSNDFWSKHCRLLYTWNILKTIISHSSAKQSFLPICARCSDSALFPQSVRLSGKLPVC